MNKDDMPREDEIIGTTPFYLAIDDYDKSTSRTDDTADLERDRFANEKGYYWNNDEW